MESEGCSLDATAGGGGDDDGGDDEDNDDDDGDVIFKIPALS
jgi:hypothetical protein